MSEFSAYIISILLTMGGVTAPGVASDAPTADKLMSAACAAQNEDSCLATPECDVFATPAGEQSCSLACDLRTSAATCDSGDNCAWIDGACDYAADDSLGC